MLSSKEIQGLLFIVPAVAIMEIPLLLVLQRIYTGVFGAKECPHGIRGGVALGKCEICNKVCIHGIPGGVTRGLCDKCMEICPHGFIGGATRGICPWCTENSIDDNINMCESNASLSVIDAESMAEHITSNIAEPKETISNTELWEKIEKMNGYEFEDYVCNLYESLGYEVEHTPYSGDGGKDAILRKNGDIYLVECKHYLSGRQIGERDLRIFDSAMHDYNAKMGFYINLGRFKRGTISFAKEHNIELIGRKELQKLIETAEEIDENSDIIGV
jgi:HJR/Mrr/RecB family endonuclease